MRKIFNKKIFFIVFASLLSFSSICLAVRQTEITYPNIDGTITPVSIETLFSDYVHYIFRFFVIIAGLFCFISLIRAGILYMTSTGKPGVLKKSKEQILAAFLGTVLVLSSFMIARTINPQLIVPYFGVEVIDGVSVYSEADCSGLEKNIVTDNSDFGFEVQSIQFTSDPSVLKVTLYALPNFGGASITLDSRDQEHINLAARGLSSAQSVKFNWELPGIYLCTGQYEQNPDGSYKCTGKEGRLPHSTALLDDDFNDKIQSIRLKPAYKTIPFPGGELLCQGSSSVGGLSGRHWYKEGGPYCTYPTIWFSTVLHEYADRKGRCRVLEGGGYEAVIDLADKNFVNMTTSITVFTKKYRNGPDPSSLLGGVWFCKDINPNKTDPGCYGPLQYAPEGKATSLPYDYPGVGIIPDDDISSIIIEEGYIAILFADPSYEFTCQVFQESDAFLRDDPIGRCKCIMGDWGCKDCLSSFIILPTTQ